jgi:hypothetical protein
MAIDCGSGVAIVDPVVLLDALIGVRVPDP